MRVAVLLDNGYEELEAMAPIALLKRAGLDVDLVSIINQPVTGRFGISYSPVESIDEYDFSQADCIVLPGGPQYATMGKNEKVLKLLPEFLSHKVVGAICAAPTILGHQGLLKGRKYTCFQSMNEDFGGEYVEAYTVTDKNLVTAVSAAASIEFGFALMEVLCGKEHTDQVKEDVYYGFSH
ncbi:MAG: DJ-1/PfpI family protein [Erysipelotrichaceae bacterium]|nr:DJ-1/PfpI family protein [Erysipelotrichaceae bacterium]